LGPFGTDSAEAVISKSVMTSIKTTGNMDGMAKLLLVANDKILESG